MMRPPFTLSLPVARRLCLLVLAVWCGALLVSAQSGRRAPEKKETHQPDRSANAIRIRTEEVKLFITVRDSLGRMVDGLKADDFFIYDNSKRYETVQFERRHMPVRLVLLLDMSAGLFKDTEAIRNAWLSFRRALAPDDRLAVMQFSHEITLTQDWKNDEATLRKALKPALRASHKSAIYDALTLAAHKLDSTIGRRVIVLFTSGLDTASLSDYTQPLAEARAAQATVYIFSQTGAIAKALRQHAQEPQPAIKNEIAVSLLALAKAEEELTVLAEKTGGQIYLPLHESNLSSGLTEIISELGAQYVMTYLPEEEAADTNNHHQIEVLVRGGYTAHTRPGYQRQRFMGAAESSSSSGRNKQLVGESR